MTERIGVVVGMEDSFPQAFIAKVNETPGFKAELAKIGGTPEMYTSPYRVLIDRISHEVPFYRFYLKAAQLAGTYVINDPLWWSADEKFFGFSLAAKIGVKVPRTVMLPQKAYMERINPQKSLRNLEFPLDWDGITKYVGFPAILKPADGGGWRNVTKVNNMEELLAAYDASGELVMTLQEFIDFDDYVRCICIGREFIQPIKYDPKQVDHRGWKGKYIEADGWLGKALETQVLDGAWALNHALGYDMNSVEFAIKDGVPYAIDFTNPAPDMGIDSILPKYFHIVIDQMAKFAIKVAREGKQANPHYAFNRYIQNPVPRPKGLCEYQGPATAARKVG